MKRHTLLAVVFIIALVISIDLFYFANQPVTLNFYAHPDLNGALRESITAFEEENPKIHINLVELPDNTNEKFDIISSKLALKDGSIDILDSDVTWPSIFVKAGWVAPLDAYFTEEELSAYFTSAIDSARVNKHLYGIPYRFDSGLIFYRKDLLEQYGFQAPTSFEALIATSKAIQAQENGLYGYAGSWKNFEGLTCNFLELLWASGGELISDEVDPSIVHIDPKAGYKALKLMSDLIDTHHLTPENATGFSSGDLRKNFTEGHLLFIRDWPAGWAVINADDSPVKGKVGAMPMVSISEPKSSPGTYGGWQYMISNHSRHKLEAVKFLKFMTQATEQRKAFENFSYLPTRIQLYNDETLSQKMPFVKSMVSYFNEAKTRPRSPHYDEITLIIQNEVHKTLLGEQQPEEAIIHMNEMFSKLE